MSYQMAHIRVKKLWGSASEHLCAWCLNPAKQWAYLGNAPDEKRDRNGSYSMISEYYVPMCVACHLRMDETSAGLQHKRLLETDEEYRKRDKIRAAKAGAVTAGRIRSDPEFAERHRQNSRLGGLASQDYFRNNPEAQLAKAESARLGLGGKATAARLKVDLEFAEQHRENSRRGGSTTASILNKKRYRCMECDLTTTPGSLARHQKAKGHAGRIEVVVCP